MRKALGVSIGFLMLAVVAAQGHEPGATGPGDLSPDAPSETSQFGFLVGEWSCGIRFMGPDGALADGPPATWTAHYILGGSAIQDYWASTGRDGKPSWGTNIRSFNPETRKWDNRWLDSGTLQWKYFEAEKVGDTMVMTGEGVDGQSRSFLDRNTFHEIGKDSFKWRKDRSFDEGETWFEGVARIECRTGGDS